MSRLTLGVDDDTIPYAYRGKRVTKDGGKTAHVTIPDVGTVVRLGGDADTLEVEEGIAFSPVYHLRARKTMEKGAFKTCLNLQKAN